MSEAVYDRIGHGYASARRADPRIAAHIESALGDAQTILNVGAGTGSYEPLDRQVIAVEPSAAMIAQRPVGSASVEQARAEELPFGDESFDAVMAIISDHHWSDRAAGLREMQRVARRRVLLLNADPSLAESFWMTRDYLPGFVDLIPQRYRQAGYWEQELRDLLEEIEVRPVPVPFDCHDGFYQAYWRRPHAYLDQEVRRAISVFQLLPATEVSAAIEQLGCDLKSGRWEERHRRLHTQDELDVGLRLVVSKLD